MYFPEEFIKNIFEKMDVECSQHAIEELDNELFNYGTYLSEKIVQYTKESGFTEIQKEDILISLLYGFYYKEYIPNAPIQRLIKTTKAEKVSPDAVETLAVEIEKKIISILEKIEELSAKNKQKDINLEDIQKVLK